MYVYSEIYSGLRPASSLMKRIDALFLAEFCHWLNYVWLMFNLIHNDFILQVNRFAKLPACGYNLENTQEIDLVYSAFKNCNSQITFIFPSNSEETSCRRGALALAPPHQPPPGAQPLTRSPAANLAGCRGTGRGRQRRVFCARPLNPASLYRAGGARMAHPGVHQ